MMLRFIFALFLAIHGLIHLPGFLKAFGYGQFTQLTQVISKPAGAFWLVAFALFFIAAIFYFLENSYWPFLAITGLILSQVLVFTVWQDAKFGTLANLIVLLLALPATGTFFFNRMVNKEAAELVASTKNNSTEIITIADLNGLPQVIQNWLIQSGCVGKEKTAFVYLEQTGEMRTAPGGNWMPFYAEQYFNPAEPAFIWNTNVKMMPLVFMNGRDKFHNGEGNMLIKFFSLFNVVNEGPDAKINEGSAQRYLAEICWFPSAALSKYITWEQIGTSSAKATFTYGNIATDGLFEFSRNGELISFTTNRYFGGGADARLEKWQITTETFKEFNGIRIPCKSKVTWKLKEGDFNWLNLEVTELLVNQPAYSGQHSR